jgi:hypothetical protein
MPPQANSREPIPKKTSQKSAGRVAQGVGQIQTPVPPKKKEKKKNLCAIKLANI